MRSLGCSPNNGNCGRDGNAPIEALIISGRTTDSSLAGVQDYVMPAPTTQYVTFQCAFVSGEQTALLPAAA